METKVGYFQDGDGNNSSSRLLGFIVTLYALGLATSVIALGHIEETGIMVTAAAAGTIFTTIAGPAMLFMFSNKKEEGKKV